MAAHLRQASKSNKARVRSALLPESQGMGRNFESLLLLELCLFLQNQVAYSLSNSCNFRTGFWNSNNQNYHGIKALWLRIFIEFGA
jgi:hypothetical protein